LQLKRKFFTDSMMSLLLQNYAYSVSNEKKQKSKGARTGKYGG